MYVDTHAHIQFDAYKADRDAVVARCREKNTILNIVGTQKDTSRLAVEMAEQYDTMYASIGTHPIHLHSTHVDEEESSFLSREESFDEVYYEELVKSPKVIGIGECGLDLYHLPKDKSKEEVLEKQRTVFLAHVKFAEKHNLPLVIHCRDAQDEMIALLRSLNRPIAGTMHCYTGDWEHAKQYLDMGLYLGFTGVVTFPPKKLDPAPQLGLLEVIEKMPLDRILVETDSPYLAAQAYRGTRAEPWMVEEVVKKIALVRKISVEKANEQIVQNTKRLFSKIPA
jgi:TatD DNase family protein